MGSATVISASDGYAKYPTWINPSPLPGREVAFFVVKENDIIVDVGRVHDTVLIDVWGVLELHKADKEVSVTRLHHFDGAAWDVEPELFMQDVIDAATAKCNCKNCSHIHYAAGDAEEKQRHLIEKNRKRNYSRHLSPARNITPKETVPPVTVESSEAVLTH